MLFRTKRLPIVAPEWAGGHQPGVSKSNTAGRKTFGVAGRSFIIGHKAADGHENPPARADHLTEDRRSHQEKE